MEIKKIKKTKGKIKGLVIKGILNYIKTAESEKNVEKFQKALKKEGLKDVFDKKIKSFEWYPLWWYAILIFKTQEILGWTEDDVFQMGYQAAKRSLMAKIFLKYFIDIKKAAQGGKQHWKQIISTGELKIKKTDLKNKKIVFKLENFNIHPLVCADIKGYMKSMGEFIVGKKNVNIKETKCVFQGDPYHEFEVVWK